MKLNRIHAIIGLLLVLIPFTGFTREFKYIFSTVAGAVILYFAIDSIHTELRKKHRRPSRHDTFVESKPPKISPEEIFKGKPEEILPERLEMGQEIKEELKQEEAINPENSAQESKQPILPSDTISGQV